MIKIRFWWVQFLLDWKNDVGHCTFNSVSICILKFYLGSANVNFLGGALSCPQTYAGRGIGSMLVKAAIDFFRGLDAIKKIGM